MEFTVPLLKPPFKITESLGLWEKQLHNTKHCFDNRNVRSNIIGGRTGKEK